MTCCVSGLHARAAVSCAPGVDVRVSVGETVSSFAVVSLTVPDVRVVFLVVPSDILPGADTALPLRPFTGGDSRVLRCVFVAPGAMGLLSVPVRPVNDGVSLVIGVRSPVEVIGPVVVRYSVLVARLVSFGAWTDPRGEEETVGASGEVPFSVPQSNHMMPGGGNPRGDCVAAASRSSPVGVRLGSDGPEVRYLESASVPGYWLELFHVHIIHTIEGGHHQ